MPVLVQSKTLRIMSFEAKSKRWDRDELRAIVIFRTPASSFPVNELEYGRISKKIVFKNNDKKSMLSFMLH